MNINHFSGDPNIAKHLGDIERAKSSKDKASGQALSDDSFRRQHVYRSIEDEDQLVGINEGSCIEWHRKLVVKFCRQLFNPHTSNLARAQHYVWVMEERKPNGEIIPFSFQACCLFHDAFDMEQVQSTIDYKLKKEGIYDGLMEYIDSGQFSKELTEQERKFREDETLQGNLFGAESDKQFRRKSPKEKKVVETAESCGLQPDMFHCLTQGNLPTTDSNES